MATTTRIASARAARGFTLNELLPAPGAAQRAKRSRRFTLVELMVVIAVIAVLAAMLLPVLGRARDRSRQTVCMSNLRQVGMGIILYGTEVLDGRLPPENRNLKLNYLALTTFRGDLFASLEEDYNVVEDLWYCPSNPLLVEHLDPVHGSMYGWDLGQPWPDGQDVPNKNGNYMYLAAYYGTSNSPAAVGVAEAMPARFSDPDVLAGPMLTDRVSYHTFDWPGVVDNYFINHRRPNGWVDGGNQVYADGHAVWCRTYPEPLVPVVGGNAVMRHSSSSSNSHYWW